MRDQTAAFVEISARISESIRGRFDSRPQKATYTLCDRPSITFDLSSREDGDRSLTVMIPGAFFVTSEGIIDLPTVIDVTYKDTGYYGYVQWSRKSSWAELRIDHKEKTAFWMQANLSSLLV